MIHALTERWHPPSNEAMAAPRPSVRLGRVDDPQEREAERAAEDVAAGCPVGAIGAAVPSGAPRLRRAGLATAGSGATPGAGVAAAVEAVADGGVPLTAADRAYFEPRFGRDLSAVRLHADAAAARAAAAIGARAFALGERIAVGAGAPGPGTTEGRRLLAHELAHVIQNRAGASGVIRRDCSDPDFCTPYPTDAEADEDERWIRDNYMALEGIATFGTEVEDLYQRFLSRSPGDSLDPVVFDSPSSYLQTAFRESGDTEDDMDAVLELVGARLSRAPGWPPRSGAWMLMSLRNFLSESEMDNRPINYSNPFSVAGHIAGNVGSSDAGPDYRKITRANVSIARTEIFEGTGYDTVTLIPHYEVFDAIDFCPGDCGSPAEQVITIPMSRLEASGRAYDQPFKVVFSPEPRSERFWF